MAAGTNVSADRHLRRSPAQIWEIVRGVVPGGLMGAVKARWLVVDIVMDVMSDLGVNWMVD